MAADHLRTLLDAIATENAGGWTGETVARCFHPAVRNYPIPEWPGDTVYEGHDGMRRIAEEWRTNFDDFQWEIDRSEDHGDRMVVGGRITGRLKGTDVSVDQPIAALVLVLDGMLGDVHYFTSYDAARSAAAAD